METLIVAAEDMNHYYGNKSPSKSFRQINCRTFQSGVGLLPIPKTTKGSLPQVHSPRSPKSVLPVDRGSRTNPIPIVSRNGSQIRRSSSEFVEKRRSLSYSERWAGPTYSNSPPPASVPIPKFSLPQKRTVSLCFPARGSTVDVCGVAKSAPVSPTSSGDNPFHSTVSATMTLRRMLNLESADE